MVGIASSTGGPQALVQLLGGLGTDLPVPVLLVQHITASFLEGFVVWLDGICDISIAVAREGDRPAPGKVYVAPPERHLRLEAGRLVYDSGPMVCSQRPSGTVLLRSMARSLGSGTLGVVLTGMGEDGAEGLLEVRQAGGFTIAEHESTAIVYGMPGSAVRMGAVQELLPLPAIAPRIRELVAPVREAR